MQQSRRQKTNPYPCQISIKLTRWTPQYPGIKSWKFEWDQFWSWRHGVCIRQNTVVFYHHFVHYMLLICWQSNDLSTVSILVLTMKITKHERLVLPRTFSLGTRSLEGKQRLLATFDFRGTMHKYDVDKFACDIVIWWGTRIVSQVCSF